MWKINEMSGHKVRGKYAFNATGLVISNYVDEIAKEIRNRTDFFDILIT